MEPEVSLPCLHRLATCPYPEPDQSTPCPHSSSWRSVLMLSSHLRLGLPSGLFSQVSPPQPSHFPHTCYMPTHILLDLIAQIIFGDEYRSLSSSLYSFLHSPVPLSLLGPNISHQHPILKHPQPTFFPQCERPSFTPIQNNRQNYSFVFLNLDTFG